MYGKGTACASFKSLYLESLIHVLYEFYTYLLSEGGRLFFLIKSIIKMRRFLLV